MEPAQLKIHVQKMQIAAREAYASRVSFTSINSDLHREVLARAIKNVLSTELAVFTFAQIVDGLPTADVAWDRRYPGIFGDHIIDDVHAELCSGAMEKARELYENWDPTGLVFDPKVTLIVDGQEDCSFYSRSFNNIRSRHPKLRRSILA